MDLRWLEDFLALAEQRTFARAAAVRRITQPAFSRRIRALEEWLGTELFLRSAQGAVLTPAGKFLRTPAEELTRNLYQLRQATLEVADREASTLSIAATHALSFVFFPNWIRNHVLFGTLGPVNLISDTLEACEERAGETMAKIKVANPVVELDGDEMTRILGAEVVRRLRLGVQELRRRRAVGHHSAGLWLAWP